MKLLLLGSTGLLGQAVAAEAVKRGFDLIEAARSGTATTLDISNDSQLATALERHSPDLVFNCAAMTDIGECEVRLAEAYRVNARPLAALAEWSRANKQGLVHVSTDQYFTEGGNRPHSEQEPVRLVNEYARTKFAGEAFALTSPQTLVLRTGVVGIRRWSKPTFAEWAIRSMERGDRITLFADAYTSSIDVRTFARAAFDLAARNVTGLINLAAREVYSKESFVRELATQLGHELGTAKVGSVAELFPRRAASLGLDVGLAERKLGYRLPDMQSVVAEVARQYRESART